MRSIVRSFAALLIAGGLILAGATAASACGDAPGLCPNPPGPYCQPGDWGC